jgi:hypothetical protein
MPKPEQLSWVPPWQAISDKTSTSGRQVGAFGGFALETSMDLDNMLFPAGSTFVFGSWIFEAGGDNKLQGRLLEDSEHQDMIFPVGSTFIFGS